MLEITYHTSRKIANAILTDGKAKITAAYCPPKRWKRKRPLVDLTIGDSVKFLGVGMTQLRRGANFLEKTGASSQAEKMRQIAEEHQ